MIKIKSAVETLNYDDYKEHAHSLKGASGYIGASRIHYACYYIQDHHYTNKKEKMLEYYP